MLKFSAWVEKFNYRIRKRYGAACFARCAISLQKKDWDAFHERQQARYSARRDVYRLEHPEKKTGKI